MRRSRIRTWSGPVDLASAEVECWEGEVWNKVGGREQLERLERRSGRLFLKVSGRTGEFITLSRQSTAAKMPGRSEAERTYGRELGHALLLMEVAGVGMRNAQALGAAAARCGDALAATSAIRSASALVGGGANRWAADLSRALTRDPGSLAGLSLLVSRDGKALGGARPKNLQQALRLASVLRESHARARAAGSEAHETSREVRPDGAPKQQSESWDGWEIVIHPESGEEAAILRAAAQMGVVSVSDEQGKSLVLLRVDSLARVPQVGRWLAKAASGHLAEEGDQKLLSIGVPGAGLRFRFCAEFDQLEPSEARAVTDTLDHSEPGKALRRHLEDRGERDMRRVATHLSATGESIADLPVNRALRVARLASEGFDPKGHEWRTLMEVDA